MPTGQISMQVRTDDQTAAGPYCYNVLESKHIRLFRVLDFSDEIFGEMKELPLEDCPEYHTLSYAWGSGSFSHRVMLDGNKHHSITEHLHQGLKSILPLLSPTWLWIDQICINQNDSEDKASQVALMGDIYANAVQTIVWLGPAYQKSDLAMTHVEGVAELIREYDFDAATMALPPVELGFPHEDEQVWPAFQCLFRRSWWKRLWIIQEVVKAKDVVFVAGSLSASYHDFVTFASAHDKLVQLFPDGPYKLGILSGLSKAFYCLRNDVLRMIDSVRSQYPARDENGLDSNNIINILGNMITVYAFSQNQSCTVPVDRVYAILGLISRQISDKIVIDYSDENREQYWRTYLRFHRHLISKFLDGGYGFTTVFLGQHTSTTPASLPSWCPELINPFQIARPYSTGVGAGRVPSSAAWKPDYRMIEPCDTNHNILHVTGFRVDLIKTLIPLWSAPRPMLFDKLTCRDATDIKKPLITCMNLAETTRKSPDDWTWMEALFRTWVMNTKAQSQDVYPSDIIGTDCLAFINRLTAIIQHQHDGQALNATEVSKEATRYASAFFEYTRGRAFCLTEGGRLGLCDATAEPGDEVAIWFNCSYPVVQRILPGLGGCQSFVEENSANLVGLTMDNRINDADIPTWLPGKFPGERREQQHRKLLGLCYVDDLMQGEVFTQRDIGKEGYSNFLIV